MGYEIPVTHEGPNGEVLMDNFTILRWMYADDRISLRSVGAAWFIRAVYSLIKEGTERTSAETDTASSNMITSLFNKYADQFNSRRDSSDWQRTLIKLMVVVGFSPEEIAQGIQETYPTDDDYIREGWNNFAQEIIGAPIFERPDTH
ncbi:MAG: hypothetical protein Q8P16_02500 [bacterium]|nr:hypothetical protein [bacterium]